MLHQLLVLYCVGSTALFYLTKSEDLKIGTEFSSYSHNVWVQPVHQSSVNMNSTNSQADGTTTTTQQPLTTTTPATLPKHHTDSPLEILKHNAYTIGDWKVCGRNGKNIDGTDSESETSLKDWPWMAVFLFKAKMEHFCGGTLITKRHILTAAHCFNRVNKEDIVLSLGDYDVTKQNDSKSRLFGVLRIIQHEGYDENTYENDIAIIEMNTTTIYNSYIQPCCLPFPGPRYPNATAVVQGWGLIGPGNKTSDVLLEAEIPIWEQRKCRKVYVGKIFHINVCAAAYEGHKDACQMDSGGPLVTQRKDGRWIVVGIVSWGGSCGKKGFPSIYTRVNDYLDWIYETI